MVEIDRESKPGKTALADSRLFPFALFFLTVILRIPFTSKLLYHMDSVQFALALEQFDITVHQPHPPGYFLYVMLGRLVNFLTGNANSAFVSVSVVFSGLTVVAVYYLGKDVFDEKIGILAGLLTLTSPTVWFHGEVALSYIVEAFLSALAALLCWKIYSGKNSLIWLSAVTLAVAGGIRQNILVFLLPLWLFSVKGAPKRMILTALALIGFVCLLWFIPMLSQTGGWDAYRAAFRELWLFNTGTVSVFERGWSSLKNFSFILLVFTIYGLGAGLFVLVTAVYSLVRRRRLHSLDTDKVLFFAAWLLPPVLFYLLIFIHPTNPGYALAFLPALIVLTAASINYMSNEIKQGGRRRVFTMIASVVIILNVSFFLFSSFPVSRREIRDHDRDLSLLLDAIKSFDPSRTAIFVVPYTFFGYRQIMYYLPRYRAYQIDARVAPTGEIRKTFWGVNHKTFVDDEVVMPEEVRTFLIPLISGDKAGFAGRPGVEITDLHPTDIALATGDISLIKELIPELRVRWPYESTR